MAKKTTNGRKRHGETKRVRRVRASFDFSFAGRAILSLSLSLSLAFSFSAAAVIALRILYVAYANGQKSPVASWLVVPHARRHNISSNLFFVPSFIALLFTDDHLRL